MKTEVLETKPWQRVINVEIPEQEVEEEYQVKVNKYKRDISLPGFRKGKVPLNLLKSRFGTTIRAETIDDLIKKSYTEACSAHNLNPVSEGKVSELKADDEHSPITFSIEIEIDPEIEITGYKNVNVSPSPKEIEQKDIDEVLENLRERLAEVKDVDRPSQNGDLITVDYKSVFVDGEEKNDLQFPSYPIEIGKSSLKDFDSGLVGLKADDTATITVTFPDDYHADTVAGKTGEIAVHVKKVQEKNLPEVNEEFCKKVGDFADVTALKNAIKEDLENREKERARNEAQEKAIDILIENNTFEVPPSRIEMYLDHVWEEEARYYPKERMPDREMVAERYRDIGIRSLKRYRIIEYIAKKEKIKATQEDVDNRIRLIAEQYKQPFEEVKNTLRKSGTTMRIRDEIKTQKVLNSLIGEIPWENENM